MKPILYLAPIRGFTDRPYRNALKKHFNFFDKTITPFIPAACPIIKKSFLTDVDPNENFGFPIIPQILSNDAEPFILFAKTLFDNFGYKEVNLNLGCPHPMVAKKKRGSGLLPFPDEIDKLFDSALKTIPNKLSIKLRLGRNNINEIFNIIPILNKYPLTEIIIHPRTGIQAYDGDVDLQTFSDCIKEIKHPIVYSGDIYRLSDYQKLKNLFPKIDRWMLGRGALMNPFLAGTIKGQIFNNSEKLKKLKDFHDEVFSNYDKILSGPGHVLDKMKGFWIYFSHIFEFKKNFMKKIKRANTKKDYMDAIDFFFENTALKNF